MHILTYKQTRITALLPAESMHGYNHHHHSIHQECKNVNSIISKHAKNAFSKSNNDDEDETKTYFKFPDVCVYNISRIVDLGKNWNFCDSVLVVLIRFRKYVLNAFNLIYSVNSKNTLNLKCNKR